MPDLSQIERLEREIEALKDALRDLVRQKETLANIVREQNRMIQEQIFRRKRVEAKLDFYEMVIRGN